MTDNIDYQSLYFRMKEISELVPISEIEYIINCIDIIGNKKSKEEAFTEKNINNAGYGFLQNRLINQVCHNCGKNARQGFRKIVPDNYPYLFECNNCKMTYYCSKECQENDWNIHKNWCCNPNGPRDLGVNKTVIININTGEIIR